MADPRVGSHPRRNQAQPLRLLGVRRDDALTRSELERALNGLPAAERERILRYRFAADRERGVLAAWLARRALAEATGGLAADLEIRRDAAGRPFLVGWSGDFNLSHSGEWVICGVVRRGRVGVDVQESRPVSPRLARHCCSPDESALLAGLAAPRDRAFLLALWTVKEAVLKASGVGLAVSPPALSLVPETVSGPAPILRSAPAAVGTSWRLWHPTLAPGYDLAVCADRSRWSGRVVRLGPRDVLFGRLGGGG